MHISMPVLIGVGGEPTLGQHQYNRAYFQTPGRYMCNTKIFTINYSSTYSQVA